MKEAAAKMSINGWEEQETFAAPAPQKHARVFAKKQYEGELQGDSELEYLLCYTDAQTSHYIGYERFTGQVDGKQGSFVLQVEGFYGDGAANERGTILAGAGTGALADLRGELTYKAKHTEQKHDATLRYHWGTDAS